MLSARNLQRLEKVVVKLKCNWKKFIFLQCEDDEDLWSLGGQAGSGRKIFTETKKSHKVQVNLLKKKNEISKN